MTDRQFGPLFRRLRAGVKSPLIIEIELLVAGVICHVAGWLDDGGAQSGRPSSEGRAPAGLVSSVDKGGAPPAAEAKTARQFRIHRGWTDSFTPTNRGLECCTTEQ